MSKLERTPGPDPLVAIGDGRERTELEPYEEFVRLGREGRPVALVTVIGCSGSAPRGMGAAMAVRGDGTIVGTVGGGNLELEMIREALAALRDGRPRRYHFDFSGGPHQNLVKACLGKADFLIQPCVPLPRLVIFGGGHVAQALAPMAHLAGFRVTVADDRPGYPPAERFSDAVTRLEGPFEETIEGLGIDETTYLVVVTYEYATDARVVRACLHRPWRYLGVIGSRAKASRLRKELGVDATSRERLARIHAPIGLPVGGRTPGEIAVAIAAELVSVRNGYEGRDERGAAGKGRGRAGTRAWGGTQGEAVPQG